MPLKQEFIQLTGIFAITMILLGFAIWFSLQDAYFMSAVFLGSTLLLFGLMIKKGRSMKEEHLEDF